MSSESLTFGGVSLTEWALVEHGVRTFYRVARNVPPGEAEYRTKRQKDGDPPRNSPAHIEAAYDGLSAYDSEDGARSLGMRLQVLGTKIVRYHVPANAGIRWEPSFGPGHFTLSGDLANLANYLDEDYVADV